MNISTQRRFIEKKQKTKTKNFCEHFPNEMNSGGSKTPATFIPFHISYDYSGN